MSTVNQEELKAIKDLKFTGKESEWDHWSETFVALERARGFAGILLGTEKAPSTHEEIDRKNEEHSNELTETERKEKKRLRQANGNAYINLQLSCVELPYDLVSLAKTEELPDGCARDAWERLTSEYDLTEGDHVAVNVSAESIRRCQNQYHSLADIIGHTSKQVEETKSCIG